MSNKALLSVSGLGVEVQSRSGALRLTQDVCFDVQAGSTLGLVGESGSGKTITSLALMGLLPRACRVAEGSVLLNGRELTSLSARELRSVQATEMAMIFQDGARSLHPAFKVGDQIAAVVRQHRGLSRAAAMRRAIEMLEAVGIREPAKRAAQYPHTFSGGMSQRAMIALALVCEPRLLIADEPTTALDVTVQAQILRLIKRLQREMGLGVLFITHDMGVVAEMCDRVAVMYAGQIVEDAEVVDLFDAPSHPYTTGLLGAIPDPSRRGQAFGFIPGTVPDVRDLPAGCRFAARCPHRLEDTCDGQAPALRSVGNVKVRCARTEDIQAERRRHECAA
ncbi:MAG TPA: ABC transporter ATP-binding protein [Ramlibacter sp.]|nr:ABC transporter ATP-binding protein [Ramlibacter sp.]